ncbi:LamG domain-containing protein [Actinoplanes sp. KI2]|uniref:LamG domain-containing protein n=1 Tax=Actinoplanes sp. KI2 TaxID=2983315 RepID=UPI0021D56E2B|nr:LamG domain-containing protein [Actinoplanes sp. KI2]MCU7731058.1 LamG domain-containing protein [Actinoplanes sp. KI2]
MRSRWLALLTVPALAWAPPAGAGVPTGGVVTARYTFNGRSGSVIDASGHGHTLRIVSRNGGTVRAVVHGQGTAFAFPPRCTTAVCPHVALQAPSSADLNPGNRNFGYGADVLLAPSLTSDGQNVVQKGYSTTSSQWKLQIDGLAGRPSCVLVDMHLPVIWIAVSSVSVANGRWHALACRRAGTALVVFVDGVPRGRAAVPATLSVANRRPLSIGSKGSFPDNDQFNGALDNVWVEIG